ncbi:hypothetical protein [Parapedobacter sp. 2B3]|uniref:hypothetical protein n=1 Tax=Parapedobacter sp. 2B3 TaxID=3342381 RepID=UPI0035B584B6
MTFEEFFAKKRIDLVLLRRSRPALYEEFCLHYAQMGEKSFDHTKKYWFNRLRKDFLLQVAETPKAATAAPASVAKAMEMPVSTAEAAKPAGFKPRFKPNAAKPASAVTPEVPQETIEEEDTASAITPPVGSPAMGPSGFKPRFRPGVTTPAKKAAESTPPVGDSQSTPEEPAPEAKPLGFKPRFKAGVTPVKNTDADEVPPSEQSASEPAAEPPAAAPVSKPMGFTPRFKAGKTTNKSNDAT